MKKMSGKDHSKEQLDAWANMNNPNNKNYWANVNNRAKQLSTKPKTHSQRHNAQRRYENQGLGYVLWAPDYPEWDD